MSDGWSLDGHSSLQALERECERLRQDLQEIAWQRFVDRRRGKPWSEKKAAEVRRSECNKKARLGLLEIEVEQLRRCGWK